MELVFSTVCGLLRLAAVVLPVTAAIALIYILKPPKSYVMRKAVHTIWFGGTGFMLYDATSPAVALCECAVITAALYPLLSVLERYDWFEAFFVQKSKGEIKRTLLMLYGAAAFMIAVSWGVLHGIYCVFTAVIMWGTGDAAAALVGIPYGKHKIKTISDGNKSVEGSLAMLAVSAIFGCTLNFLPGACEISIAAVLLSAVCATLTELLTKSEYDTLTVPLTVWAVLLVCAVI